MEDIVKRLRSNLTWQEHVALAREAADEIEAILSEHWKLRATLMRALGGLRIAGEHLHGWLAAEVRARAEEAGTVLAEVEEKHQERVRRRLTRKDESEGVGVTAIPKQPALRDRKYLDFLRGQPCILTGIRGNGFNAVDTVHVGTAGKGLKSPDNEALPVLHVFHQEMHQRGEVTVFRDRAPDWLIREALRAYAREYYERWKRG